jgi:HlyD family secretion protein
MAKSRKKFWIILIVILLVIAALGVVNAVLKKRGKAIAVTIEAVEKGKIVSLVTANGKVEAKTKVNISSDIMGKIVNLPVVEGQQVEKGQLLVEIERSQNMSDVAQMRALLASAKVDEEQAKINYDRMTELLKRNLVPQSEFDMARTNLDRTRTLIRQYEANLDRAQTQLQKCTILSPMAGTITKLNSEVGENVIIGTMNNLGTVIMVVSDLSEIEVKTDVDETDVAKLAVGQKAEVALDAFPDKKFTGKVTEIGNAAKVTGTSVQEQVTNFEVKILVTDKVPGIKPGMNATVDITTDVRDEALKIPIQAVVMRAPTKEKEKEKGKGAEKSKGNETAASKTQEPAKGTVEAAKKENVAADEKAEKEKAEPGKTEPGTAEAGKAGPEKAAAKGKAEKEEEVDGVFLVEGDIVKFVPVKAGISDQQYIEIVSGLKEGQKIATGSYKTLRTLKDGDKVKAEEKPAEETGVGAPKS